jgi:hypothetical protein
LITSSSTSVSFRALHLRRTAIARRPFTAAVASRNLEHRFHRSRRIVNRTELADTVFRMMLRCLLAFLAVQHPRADALRATRWTMTAALPPSPAPLIDYWPGQREGASPPAPDPSALASRLPPEHRNALILPGFGNDASDYTTPFGQPSACGLVAALRRRGFRARVAPIYQKDWLRVASGALREPRATATGTTRADGAAYGWYITAARAALLADEDDSSTSKEELNAEPSSERGGDSGSGATVAARTIVIGHSAGGWLARAAVCLDDTSRARCAAVVSLGAPHAPPEPGVFDATRGATRDVLARCAPSGGDDDDDDAPPLVCVAGNAVRADGASELAWERVALTSYGTLLGDVAAAGVLGDGVVPARAALLDGAALRLTIDALHSVNVAGTTRPSSSWYGAERQVDRWLGPTIDLLLERGVP